MIHKLQRLKSKRGFTMLELVVVIAIIAVMVASVLVSGNSRQSRINSANTAAYNFYSALQTEFTNFQMFDGPLTMTLNSKYSEFTSDVDNLLNGAAWKTYGGIKYYPAVGGNYPFAFAEEAEPHLTGTPKNAEIYLEFQASNGNIRVWWAKTMNDLISGGGAPDTSELSAVLEQEMKDRINYNDGYYYAKVSYKAPTGVELSRYDYRAVSVKVDWTAYTNKQMKAADSATYRFKSQNILFNGQVCGVCAGNGSSLGTTGTTFVPTVSP